MSSSCIRCSCHDRPLLVIQEHLHLSGPSYSRSIELTFRVSLTFQSSAQKGDWANIPSMTVDEGLELDAFEGQLKIVCCKCARRIHCTNRFSNWPYVRLPQVCKNRFFPEVMVIDVYWRYSIASFPGVPLWMKILLQSQATLMDAVMPPSSKYSICSLGCWIKEASLPWRDPCLNNWRNGQRDQDA